MREIENFIERVSLKRIILGLDLTSILLYIILLINPESTVYSVIIILISLTLLIWSLFFNYQKKPEKTLILKIISWIIILLSGTVLIHLN